MARRTVDVFVPGQADVVEELPPERHLLGFDRVVVGHDHQIGIQPEGDGKNLRDIWPKGLLLLTARPDAQEHGNSYDRNLTGPSHRVHSNLLGIVW